MSYKKIASALKDKWVRAYYLYNYGLPSVALFIASIGVDGADNIGITIAFWSIISCLLGLIGLEHIREQGNARQLMMGTTLVLVFIFITHAHYNIFYTIASYGLLLAVGFMAEVYFERNLRPLPFIFKLVNYAMILFLFVAGVMSLGLMYAYMETSLFSRDSMGTNIAYYHFVTIAFLLVERFWMSYLAKKKWREEREREKKSAD